MAVSKDLSQGNFGNAQGALSPKPMSIASTTTIAPTTLVTLMSGTIDVATITSPFDGAGFLFLVPTDASPGDLLTTGNILVGTTTLTQNVPVILIWNPIAAKWYVK